MSTTEESFANYLAEDSDLSTCLTFENGFVKGHTISSKEVVLSQQECADLCYNTENCIFWQWADKATHCWLKSKGEIVYTDIEYTESATDLTSGVSIVTGTRACGAPLGKLKFALLHVFPLQLVILLKMSSLLDTTYSMRKDLLQKVKMGVPHYALK